MSIFLNKDSKVIVQGITGGEGTKHTALMLKAGTQVVGGVNARKAGTTVSHVDKDGNDVELPVFGTVAEAMKKTGADVSIVFVPPKFAKDAIIEAIDAEIPLLVVITEGIPVQDTAYAWAYNVEKGEQDPHHRPELPRHHHPGRGAGRHHPGQHHRHGPGRPGVQVRHADLPDDVRAARFRLLHRRSASAATRSSAPPTSTPSRRSRRIPTPRSS